MGRVAAKIPTVFGSCISGKVANPGSPSRQLAREPTPAGLGTPQHRRTPDACCGHTLARVRRTQGRFSRRSESARSDLDESSCVEVTVECQSLADPSTPHHREACRINKGVLALSTRSEPAPGFGFGSFIDMHDLGVGEALQPVDKADRGRVPGAPAKESPCLTYHVVRCDDPTNSPFHQGARLLVPGVSTLLQAKPKTGVREPHQSWS